MPTERRLVLALAAVLALLILVVAWLAVGAVKARAHLQSGRDEAKQLKQALAAGNADAADAHLLALQRKTATARRQTNDVAWRIVGSIPVMGDGAAALSDATAAVDRASHEALPPLVRAVHVAAPRTLVGPRGQIHLERVERIRPYLATAAAGARSARATLPDDRGLVVWPLRASVDRVAADLDRLADAVATARRTAQIAPGLLGSDGPRKYFVAVQNPAESRGTGGLVGAYVVAQVDDGRVTLSEIGSNSALANAVVPPIDLGPEFARLYGPDPALWANSNMSPHFPYAGRLWLALWQRQHNQRLDGAIAIDVVTLGYLVGASQPVRLSDGTVLDERTLPHFVMSEMYSRYPLPEQEPERDQLTAEIGGKAVRHLLGGPVDVPALLRAVTRATQERRLQIYSVEPREQRQLATMRVGGATSTASSPYLAVIVNNGGANKLDYYLERSIRWRMAECTGAARQSRVTVTLRNAAPPRGLPAYVAGKPLAPVKGRVPPLGTSRLLVYVHTTLGARPTRAEIDGRMLPVVTGSERRHPVFAFSVDILPGSSRTVELDLTEPAVSGAPDLRVQPLVRPPEVTLDVSRCVRG